MTGKRVISNSDIDNSDSEEKMQKNQNLVLHYLLEYFWTISSFIAMFKSETTVRSRSKFTGQLNFSLS